MTLTTHTTTLADLGWSNFFLSQLDIDELDTLTPVRISAVQRATVTALSTEGSHDLTMPGGTTTGEVAVGDWAIADLARHRLDRVLDHKTLLRRGTEERTGERQLIAANLDTLFITTSCNDDFNPARLERYLALAHDAEIVPVILMTKADQADDPATFIERAQALGRNLDALAVNAKADDLGERLAPWCGRGQTVALTGSSGVGKTTIANALTGGTALTQDIREDDAKGRHTTTGRSLHRIPAGGWLIDTPGMRGLGVADVSFGIDTTFAEITELAAECRFRDCRHESEPGCAVQAAIERGEVDPDRLKRFNKLKREDGYATETIAQARERYRKFGKLVKSAQNRKKR